MRKSNVFGIIAVAALLIIIPIVTNYLEKNDFKIRISALEDDTPESITVSDINSDSFRVTWMTQRKVIGGLSISNGVRLSDSGSTSYHSILVTELKPGNTYTFQILSGQKQFGKDNSSLDYSITTAQIEASANPFLIYGQVFSADGVTFQQGGLITIVLRTSVLESQISSTTINETGGFTFNIGKLLSSDMTRTFPYKDQIDAVFTINAGHNKGSYERSFTLDLSKNRQIPNIYLGEVNIDLLPAIQGN